MSSDHRLEREAEFHDHAFTEDTRATAGRFYSITGSSQQRYYALVAAAAAHKHALEYGCGRGGYCFDLARAGAVVDAIDISPAGVEIAAAKAREDGLSGRLGFQVMNAEAMSFADGHFDVVFGKSILHHLELRKGLGEVARVLKDEGKAVFFEPLGHNLLINAYRKLTPRLRSPDERPLRAADLALFGEFFADVRIHYFHFLAMLAIPFWRMSRVFPTLVGFLDRLDRFLFKVFPALRKQAWIIVVELSHPRLNGPDRPGVKEA